MRLTIQLCTFKRAHLIGRVLEALFDQTLSPDAYEVVLVNDGSPDETSTVIERVAPLARCGFTVITQANAGLARARNAGIAQAHGERILFMDDDVLPTPVFAAEHLRSDERFGDVIVRGAVINAPDFDHLPPPIWTLANYSGNYFWTSNVSVRRARLDRAGTYFDPSFAEYGWEDIELGMRLRALGTYAMFNRFAVAFHHKPARTPQSIDALLRQVRAQARTAIQLRAKHPNWRVDAAIGTLPPQRYLGNLWRKSNLAKALTSTLKTTTPTTPLTPLQHLTAALVATDAYYTELAKAETAQTAPAPKNPAHQ